MLRPDLASDRTSEQGAYLCGRGVETACEYRVLLQGNGFVHGVSFSRLSVPSMSAMTFRIHFDFLTSATSNLHPLNRTMVCGWDKTGPNIFYVDSDGTRLKGHMFSVGSGSTFAYGVLDQGYSYDMTVEEAIALGQKSVYHATHRDAASGGVINVYHVKEDGWVKISSEDMMIQHRARVTQRKAEDEASDAAKAAKAAAAAAPAQPAAAQA